MNILIANWAWYPSGGDWTYIETVSEIYEELGHHVVPFSMKDERNVPTKYSDYFIENINYKELNKVRTFDSAVQVASKSVYSSEAVQKLRELLKAVKVDLAHLNLIHHYLTPAIIKVLKEHNIPIIWTLHDYTILCPQSTFISNDEVCERCRDENFYHCAVNRCKKRSFLASSLAAFENYFHRYLNYYKYVDYFICPSVFSHNKYRSFGFFPDKLRQIYHTYKADSECLGNYPNDNLRYIVYVGRLEKIKGVHTLLAAMQLNPNINLKIIGDGSEEVNLKTFASIGSLNNVEFLGKLSKAEVLTAIKGCDFLVCPSEWYEVLGLTIFEAMLMGKPVLGSDIGAIPESVINWQTGLLFKPGNAADLSEKINMLYNSSQLSIMGENARIHIKSLSDRRRHIAELQKLIPGL
jgi:glycosyltransferase involved in cell wall biosynthesis